jgi:DNA-binding HxlR family transcriptional regulator
MPIDWTEANAACEHLSPNQDSLVRDIVTQIAEKWTLWTMAILAEAAVPMRFSRVMEQVEGISQKSLTKTLRQLERDGLVTRTIFPEVPPRVEYQITPLGQSLLEQVHPLWLWAVANIRSFEHARRAYAATARPTVNPPQIPSRSMQKA